MTTIKHCSILSQLGILLGLLLSTFLGAQPRTVNELDSANVVLYQIFEKTENCSTKECTEERYSALSTLCYNLWGKEEQKRVAELLALLENYQWDKKSKAKIYYYISTPYNELGDYDEAINYLNLAITYSREEKERKLEMRSLANLALTYSYLEDYEKAIALDHQALQISRSIGDTSFEEYCIYGIGNKYTESGDLDSAKHYFQILLGLTHSQPKSDNYAYAVGGILDVSKVLSPEEIKIYVQQAEWILQNKDVLINPLAKRNLLVVLSEYYQKKSAYTRSINYALQHLEHARTMSADTSEVVVYALQKLSLAQAAAGKHQAAWMTYDTFHYLKMAMVSRHQADAMAKISVEMNLAENDLARKKAEQATVLEQQASAARTRFFSFLLLIAGLILVGVVWAYRRAQRDKQLISEKSQQVEQSLAEKEVLLREIHHRVKNNLQIISSLLDKQVRKSSDDAVRKLVKEGQERIQSMALIHQNLYESEQLGGIDVKSYLQELSVNIQKSQVVTADKVQLELNVEDEKLDIDTAIPVGLILNELLTNSYKYAFAGNKKGKISVDFKKENDEYFLQVSDNGIGFTPEQAATKTKSLGLNLVNGLVRQLDGTVEWLKVIQGAAVVIRF